MNTPKRLLAVPALLLLAAVAAAVSLLFSACAASPTRYMQAVPLPAPVEAPMAEPSFPHPGYTPNGAGLPGERVPGQQSPEVQHSKNWRPGGAHPELMAPDDAPRASVGTSEHHMFGVALPGLDDAKDAMANAQIAQCVGLMETAAKRAGKYTEIMEMPEALRKCMAPRAVARCADDMWGMIRLATQAGAKVQPGREDAARSALAYAQALLFRNCRGAGSNASHDAILNALADELMEMFAEAMKAGRPLIH